MANVLQAGATWLAGKMKAHAAIDVTYARGASSVALKAVIGRSEFVDEREFSVIQRIETRDYIVAAADLVLAAVPATPEAGDRITEASGEEYEVMAPAGQQPWRYGEGHRVMIRIHTKRVEA